MSMDNWDWKAELATRGALIVVTGVVGSLAGGFIGSLICPGAGTAIGVKAGLCLAKIWIPHGEAKS
jgi:hypothetical protein